MTLVMLADNGRRRTAAVQDLCDFARAAGITNILWKPRLPRPFDDSGAGPQRPMTPAPAESPDWPRRRWCRRDRRSFLRGRWG